MASRMSKVLPSLFLGSHRDAQDAKQLKQYGITHIVSVLENPRQEQLNKHYLCIMTTDGPDENLSQYFSVCNDFIHEARLGRKNVLIHCQAGIARSAVLAIAYVMTVTSLNWRDAMKVVKSERCIVNPGSGFLEQLEEFQSIRLNVERQRLYYKFPSKDFVKADKEWCDGAIKFFKMYLAKNVRIGELPTISRLNDTQLTNLTTSQREAKTTPSSLFNTNVTAPTAEAFWKRRSTMAPSATSIPENLMVNVRLYRPAPKKDRDSQGKFVKPIDSTTTVYLRSEEGSEDSYYD